MSGNSMIVSGIIITLIIGVIVVTLAPTVLTSMNGVFVFVSDTDRNPIFDGGIGTIVPLIMGFGPIVLFAGLLGVAFLKWRGGQGGMG